MPTPEQIAAMPTTPGSIVRAHVPFEDESRVRAWELHPDGRWRDTHGARRHVAQLRDVTIVWVAPAAGEGRRVSDIRTAVDAIGLAGKLTIIGPIEQDDAGIYIATDVGKFRLDPTDLVEVPDLRRGAA